MYVYVYMFIYINVYIHIHVYLFIISIRYSRSCRPSKRANKYIATIPPTSHRPKVLPRGALSGAPLKIVQLSNSNSNNSNSNSNSNNMNINSKQYL